MNVREMIQEMAKEPDMDCEVYVRLVGYGGEIVYLAIEGIALPGDSHAGLHTTLIVEPLPG